MNRSESKLRRKIRNLKNKLRKRHRASSESSESESTDSDSNRERQDSPPRKRSRVIIIDSSSDELGSNTNEAENSNEREDIIFSILGEDPTISNEFGDEIHAHIAIRWNNILQKGIKKELRSELIKKYLPPTNCILIKPPKLNDEIKAAVQDSSVKRDSKLELKQDQLGAGITCIGKAIDVATKISDKGIRDQMIKYLGDSGQILTDLHYLESITRRSLLAQGLTKNTKEAIKDLPRDHLLFGEGLTERLKAIKACSKSATEIKSKPPKAINQRSRHEAKSSNSSQPSTALNWRGSSRRITPAYNHLSAGTYRERRQPPAPTPRRTQTSQRHQQAKRM